MSNESMVSDDIITARQSTASWRPFYWHRLTLIPAWISNHSHYKLRDEIIYPFPNFNGCIVGVWEGITIFIPHFTAATKKTHTPTDISSCTRNRELSWCQLCHHWEQSGLSYNLRCRKWWQGWDHSDARFPYYRFDLYFVAAHYAMFTCIFM